MSIGLSVRDGHLVVADSGGCLASKHTNQLNFWSFQRDRTRESYSLETADVATMTQKVISYFKREGIGVCLEAEVIDLLSCGDELRQELTLAIEGGKAIKEGNISSGEVRPFLEFISTTLVRPLKIHQVKASLHLLTVRNGANFSVPGSGKTSVVLAVFEYLRKLGIVDRLFVAGPPSCFGPWRQEYEAVIGIAPRLVILAGGSVEDRRQTYASSPSADLYLTSYHTLHRDCDLLAKWLRQNGSRVFLVLDEAHYIKQLGGAWATAVLALTEFTARRCILTGTPFPRVYSDAFNLFDALWPHSTPLTTEDRIRIDMYSEAGETNNATKLLEKAVGALFYRVRKSDLGLAPQIFHPPIRIKMSPYEKMAYDEIMARVKEASRTDDLHDIDLVLRLRRGRMMRLRQSVSYAKLLATALAEYPEELVKGKLSLTDVLTRYDDLEQPAKLEALCSLVRRLREKGEKVLIWSNFVRTLHLIRGTLTGLGDSVELIYGETPTENVTLSEELTREKIIKNFTSGSTEILVANPAACAESISLHKSCAHAIYYDLSYNCAQYLQSLDRIHRVGGSENRSAHYYFLQYDDTIDADILENVLRKAERMSALIDRDYPIYSLDMFDADDELKAYERLFA